MKRLPVLATLVVLAAAATMIGLGIWQLQRARWKDALIASYRAAQDQPPVAFPTVPTADKDLPLFRYATANCRRPVGRRIMAGHNRSDESGFVVIVDCASDGQGPALSVELGWTRDPNARVGWSGGLVSGIIAPDRVSRLRLVASSAPPGLQPSAPPAIGDIANNHRSYALQWFAFAGLALLIYALALRKRFRESAGQ